MDVDQELRKLLSSVTDASQRRKTLQLWNRVKENLSDRQRLAILRAWNTYLIDSNVQLFDQTIENVIEELGESAASNPAGVKTRS